MKTKASFDTHVKMPYCCIVHGNLQRNGLGAMEFAVKMVLKALFKLKFVRIEHSIGTEWIECSAEQWYTRDCQSLSLSPVTAYLGVTTTVTINIPI